MAQTGPRDIHAYLASSGTLEDRYMTLAGVAADQQMWAEFNAAWARILGQHSPPAEYIDMWETCGLTGGFTAAAGWNHESAFALATECLTYMAQLDTKRFTMVYCGVDTFAYRKLRDQGHQVARPTYLCNTYCCEALAGWALRHYPEIRDAGDNKLMCFFDSRDPLNSSFCGQWESRSGSLTPLNFWSTIAAIQSVGWKTSAGIQAAEIVAWAVNQQDQYEAREKGKPLAHIMRVANPAHVLWDEAQLFRWRVPFQTYPPGATC